MASEQDQKKLQELSEAMQKFQDDLQSAVEVRQRLESQQTENQAVQKEFKNLAEDADIYRLVGPVLLKQEKSEARATVDGRLDYIGKEIARTETRIKDIQQNSEKTRMDLIQLQQRLQTAAQG